MPLNYAAIRLVTCFECREFVNERLPSWSASRCGGGGLLRVVHHRTALDYLMGRVKLPRNWMLQGREVLIAWEFNQFSFVLARPLCTPLKGLSMHHPFHPFHPLIGICSCLIYFDPIFMDHMEQDVSFFLHGPFAQPLKGLISALTIC